MQWWKWVGLAGIVGVTATGVAVARDERKRNSYSSDDVRARLHERAGQAGAVVPESSESHESPESSKATGAE